MICLPLTDDFWIFQNKLLIVYDQLYVDNMILDDQSMILIDHVVRFLLQSSLHQYPIDFFVKSENLMNKMLLMIEFSIHPINFENNPSNDDQLQVQMQNY